MYGLYSHCLAVDIVTSTSASAIIPTMDKIINNFGIPYKLGTDNGRPFHSHDLSNFAKRMGFEHTRVTPYAPWANGTVKYFMRNLGKVLKALHIDDHNWKMALQSFFISTEPRDIASWATYPSVQLLFINRQHKTRLPKSIINTDLFRLKKV